MSTLAIMSGTLAIMAIDPGKTGAFCIMDTSGAILDLTPRHKTRREMKNYLIQWRDSVRIAYVEHVGHRPGDGAQGSFTFGQGYGEILMGLECVGILYDTVTPQVWQASMQCMTGGNKTISLRKAQQLWPARKWNKTIADAALIAAHGIKLINDAQAQKERRMAK